MGLPSRRTLWFSSSRTRYTASFRPRARESMEVRPVSERSRKRKRGSRHSSSKATSGSKQSGGLKSLCGRSRTSVCQMSRWHRAASPLEDIRVSPIRQQTTLLLGTNSLSRSRASSCGSPKLNPVMSTSISETPSFTARTNFGKIRRSAHAWAYAEFVAPRFCLSSDAAPAAFSMTSNGATPLCNFTTLGRQPLALACGLLSATPGSLDADASKLGSWRGAVAAGRGLREAPPALAGESSPCASTRGGTAACCCEPSRPF
mmetsp:Transcript_58573/g.169966  ORF Transcript_58573/g.169966 Transcript_58573/m.169966 type:complete len:260 (+) Transcript_58573:2778-3557(+)